MEAVKYLQDDSLGGKVAIPKAPRQFATKSIESEGEGGEGGVGEEEVDSTGLDELLLGISETQSIGAQHTTQGEGELRHGRMS